MLTLKHLKPRWSFGVLVEKKLKKKEAISLSLLSQTTDDTNHECLAVLKKKKLKSFFLNQWNIGYMKKRNAYPIKQSSLCQADEKAGNKR